jgi:gamma-glutamyl:cysteine ligase YbdK (ATP-grasp superfamily)
MGERVQAVQFTRQDRQIYRDKLRTELAVLREMVESGRFETERKLVGMELELNLVDVGACPLMLNEKVLQRIESEDFQTELGQFNLEINLAPHKLNGVVFREIEEELRTSLNYAERRANELGAYIIAIGILPTLENTHVTVENFTANPRYALMNEQILAARGEDIDITIDGVERLSTRHTSIAPEAAATSTQLHLQVSPDGFATIWNAAQALLGVQLALGANSPFFLGQELWRETRIPLCEMSTDTRSEEYVAQGVRPRVWFGEDWCSGPLDLWEQNLRYFPSLLPICSEEDPQQVAARGDVPHLQELKLHNGTVYRWNRPVYDVARGKPHFRVENRVLPSGPTVADIVANAAFYFGLVRSIAEMPRPISQVMSFAAAEENFRAAAREGIDAALFWPGVGTRPATELVLRHLLPLAYEGLDGWEVDPADRDRYLGIIEQRCLAGRNGASWQAAVFHRLHDEMGLDRAEALGQMLRRYQYHMHSNEPVHTWPVSR